MSANQNNQSESERLLLQILAWLTDPTERTLAANPPDEDHRRDKLSELTENKYKTNDLVEVSRGFNERYLKINGAPTIRLTKAEFVLFLILAAHGHCLRRLSAPLGGKFLSAKNILRVVDAWRQVEPQLTGFWESATFPEVHRTVFELRTRIGQSEANPNIIETGPKGEGGYRLNTSPHNVTVDPQ